MDNNSEKTKLIGVAIFFITFTFLYFAAVTFIPIPATSQHNSDLILGFLSSGIALVLGYYYGNSNATIKPIDPNTDRNQSNPDPTKGNGLSSGNEQKNGLYVDPEVEDGDELIGNTKVEEED